MSQEKFPMTISGLEALKQELQELEASRRPQAKQRINHARNFCDFHEDSEYELALKELAEIEDRIAEIQYMIQEAEIIAKKDGSYVEIGSTVSYKELPTGEIETYMIVGTEEADPLNGRISHYSPIAKSLLGTKINDKVTIATPGGNRQVIITGIS